MQSGILSIDRQNQSILLLHQFLDLRVGSIETQLLQALLDLSGINCTWIGGKQETG